MKKSKFLLSFFLMILMLIPLGLGQQKVEATTLAEVKAKGEIVMGTSPDFPPYEFMAKIDGKQVPVGMDVEIGRKFAKDLGVKFTVKTMDFDSLLVALETGKVDFVISGLSPTDERKKSADFSDPYYHAGQYFVVNKNNRKLFKDYRSFKGKRVGVQTGSLQLALAKRYLKSSEIVQMTKVTDLLLALKSNKIDGILMESAVSGAYVEHDSELADFDSKLKKDLGDGEGTAIGFAKNTPELVAQANKTIAEIKEKKLIPKYIKESSKYLESGNSKENSWLIVLKYWRDFAKGLGYTLLITVVSLFFGIILGILFALSRLGKNKIIAGIAKAIVEFIRGTPLMIQLMFVYFGLSKLLNIDIQPLMAGFIAVSINSAAYVSEIIRSGIMSVDKGQTEAARSLGLSYKDTLQSVILPQAVKNIWPALGNEFISLIKETSIVSIIGVTDLIFQLRAVQASTYQGVIPIVIAMIIYFVVTWSLSKVLNYFERKMNHGTN